MSQQQARLSGLCSEADTLARLAQGLRAHRLLPEQVDDLRAEIRRVLDLVGSAPDSPGARRAVESAKSWLLMAPRKPEWPSYAYIGGLEAVLRELRRHCPSTPAVETRVAAAYTCVPERGDPRTVEGLLRGAAALLGGRVDYYHHDTGLRDWACRERPGWLRVERLVSARRIEALVLVSFDELIPTSGLSLPHDARKAAQEEFRQRCLSRGIRLACIDDLVRAAGAAR
ncbi:hypothetical protein ACFYZ9_38475 [Streptomyces sp. NPDC001691]|uniref:hypothetical protein n=1 Tax=Streptomyces sp. NPDC001691 TaxID=3364600 RepID=UPI0036B66088